MKAAAFAAWAALNSIAVGVSVFTALWSVSFWPFLLSWLTVLVTFNRARAACVVWRDS